MGGLSFHLQNFKAYALLNPMEHLQKRLLYNCVVHMLYKSCKQLRNLVINCLAFLLSAYAGAYDYPETPVREEVHRYGSVELNDPFAWLEVKNEETEEWFRRQDAFARGMINEMPPKQVLFERIKEIDDAKTVNIYSFSRQGERYFHLKLEIGEEVASLYYRDGIDSESRMILDPADFAKSEMVHSIEYYVPSYDGSKVAVGIMAGGNEIPDLYIIDVATGEVLEPAIQRVRSIPAWLEDGSGFYYSQMRPIDPEEDPVDRYKRRRAKFHSLGTDPAGDPVVVSFDDNPTPGLSEVDSPYVFALPESDMTVLLVSHGVDRANSLYFSRNVNPLHPDSIKWIQICSRDDKIESVDIHGNVAYLLSFKDSPRRKILTTELKQDCMGEVREFLPESERVLTGISILGGRLYITGMDGGIDFIMTKDLESPHSGFEDIVLPLIGRVTLLSNDYREPDVYISLTSWTRAAAYYRYDPADGSVVMSEFRPMGPFDAPEGLLAERIMVKSHDGVEVPLTVIRSESVQLNGNNPTILYGYGAYGISMRPGYGPVRLAWLERGGIYAVAHVRGGGEFGKEWHEAGHQETKRNSWLDFNACAQYLIDNGYAGKGTIGAMGGSMGGVLVGRAMTSRPDLYGAVVSSVGNHNPVRNHMRANGPANYPEYGNPLDPEEFPYVLAMDSYFAVRDGVDYPPMLLTSGYNDARVDSWMPGKMAARLQHANPDGGPYLMRIEFEAGHGGVARSDQLEEVADEYAFLFWALNGN